MTTSRPSDQAPTWDPVTGWITLAAKAQLARDLDDLPELVEQLDRHYHDLLAHGSRNPDDPWQRYPTHFDVLDLADRRRKVPARDERNPWLQAHRRDPLDDPRRVHTEHLDPHEWVKLELDLMEPRRLGTLPTLESWVRLADAEMWEAGEEHLMPREPRKGWAVDRRGEASPALVCGPTVLSEAVWLRMHLDWICSQQWVMELAEDLRGIVADVTALIGENRRPDDHSALCALDLAEALDVALKTVYSWVDRGHIAWAQTPEGEPMKDHKGRRMLWVVEARPLAILAARRRERAA